MLNRRIYEFDSCPVSSDLILQKQNEDEELQEMIRNGHPTRVFIRKDLGDKSLWVFYSKRGKEDEALVYVPKDMRESLTEWYHDSLKHPGKDRLLETMRLHFNWPGMTKSLEDYSKTCDICQRYKITGGRKYGKLPLAVDWDKYGPWQCVHVDMVGPWSIRYKLTKNGKIITVKLLALTIIDRVTTWPEFAIANDATAATNVILFDK